MGIIASLHIGSNSPAGRETGKGRARAMQSLLIGWSTRYHGSREKATQLQILPGVPRQAAPSTKCGHIIFSRETERSGEGVADHPT